MNMDMSIFIDPCNINQCFGGSMKINLKTSLIPESLLKSLEAK